MNALFTPLWEPLAELVRSARERVIVVSPRIGAGVVPELLSASGVPASRWRVLSVGLLEDFAARASDLEAFAQLVAAGADVRIVRGLHAKLYLADGARALYGSANLTRSGLRDDLEVAALTSDPAEVAALADRALGWHAAGRQVTASWLSEMRAQVARLGTAPPAAAQAPELEGPDLSRLAGAAPAPARPAGAEPPPTEPGLEGAGPPGDREDPYAHQPLPPAWRPLLAPLIRVEPSPPAREVPGELPRWIELALSGLTPRQRQVLGRRQAEELTLEQVGALMDVTRERIRQIEAKALARFELAARARPFELVEPLEAWLELARRPAVRLVRLTPGAAPALRQACALWAHARERPLEVVVRGDAALVIDRDDAGALEARLAALFDAPRFYGVRELAEAAGVGEEVLDAHALWSGTRLQRLASGYGWRRSMRDQLLAVARHLADAGHTEWHISQMAQALELVNPVDFEDYHPHKVGSLLQSSGDELHHSGVHGAWHLRAHGDGHRTTRDAVEAVLRDAPCPLHIGGIMAALRRSASRLAVIALLRNRKLGFVSHGGSVFGVEGRDCTTTDGYRRTEAWLHAAVAAAGGALGLPEARARAADAGLSPDWLIGTAVLSPRLDHVRAGPRSAGGFRLSLVRELLAGPRARAAAAAPRAAAGARPTPDRPERVRPPGMAAEVEPMYGLEEEERPQAGPEWTPLDPAALPDLFWHALAGAAQETADREGLALDTAGLAPSAAATCELEGRSPGGVVVVRRWRGVAVARFDGAPALLVGELDVVDSDRVEAAELDVGVRVSLVEDAGAQDAARVAAGGERGVLL